VIHNLRAAVVPVYILLCLLLGGASAAGHWANAFLQLVALAIIGWAILERRPMPMPRASRQLLALTLLMLLVVLVQLIPLPPSIWTKLPGREEIVAGYALLGMPLPWLPISVVPYLTVASLLWLLPAIAVLLGMIRLGAFRSTWIMLVLGGVTATGIALGAIQRAGNEAAYFYRITNYGQATGFFSNANHMATQLMVTIAFVAALYLAAREKSRSAQRTSALLVVLAGAAGVLMVGIAINGSLAGLGLSVPVLGASILMIISRKRKVPVWAVVPLALVAIVAVGAIFTMPLGNNLTGADRASPVSRQVSFTNTIAAAKDYFPAGSGIGSFNTIYPMYEDQATMTTTYVNHAHSDLLELALETGAPGMVMLALFLLWWIRRTVVIWRAEEPDPFARAATIASAAIMAHSLVDYPLRTAAISALFAVCCALMAEARPLVRQRDRDGSRGARHLSAD
jgi:O-antigen ligase